jgi:hypothetical protein
MSLYFVFTVDGDWEEYFRLSLPEDGRKPDKNRILPLVDDELRLASKFLAGKFVHFVHASPRARDFFLQPDFISSWKEIEKSGGSIGVHCHEDDPQRAYFAGDADRMEIAIRALAQGLRGNGLDPIAYRGGYMAFTNKTIPILEENRLFLDFSCEPGRYLYHGNLLVSDWRGAPDNYYQMDYSDHRKPGKSRVYEIPLGRGFYLEKDSLWKIWNSAIAWKKRAAQEDVIVAVLAHTYDFRSFWMQLKIKLALLILKRYGRFVNTKDVLGLVSNK